MSEWFISEQGDAEDGFIWDLLKKDGNRAILVAQFFDERLAEEILEAAKWREAFLSGVVRLAMDGVFIDSNTGLTINIPATKPVTSKGKTVKKKPRT